MYIFLCPVKIQLKCISLSFFRLQIFFMSWNELPLTYFYPFLNVQGRAMLYSLSKHCYVQLGGSQPSDYAVCVLIMSTEVICRG